MSTSFDGTADATVAGSVASSVKPEMSWVLTVVGCDDLGSLARRRVLEPGTTTLIGRGSDVLGPGALDDSRLSRRHAELTLDDGRPRIRDLGSHNGTLVNGARVESASLAIGSVLTLGKTVLLVHRAPTHLSCLAPIDELVGCGQAHVALLDAVHKVAARSTPICLLGPPGAGKSHLARVIHTQGQRPGPARVLHCAGLPDERAFELLQADATTARGTLILEGVGEAGPALQARLLPLLDAAAEGTTSASPRIIATSHEALQANVSRPDLIDRLSRWIIHLPALAARPEDMPLLAQHFVRRYAGAARPFHPTLTAALLHHRWPGNIRELDAVIENLCIDIESEGPLRLTPRVVAMLGLEVSTQTSGPGVGLLVDGEGRWFELLGQTRVEIGRRKTLARVLGALVAQRKAAPGVVSTVAELLAAGWPEERVLERAGANRVHVALTTLRKLGLRELLLRRDEGYLLDPQVEVAVESAT